MHFTQWLRLNLALAWQHELSEEDKDTIKNKIDRDSPEDKLKDLLDWIYAIRDNEKHLVSHVKYYNKLLSYLLFTSIYYHS